MQDGFSGRTYRASTCQRGFSLFVAELFIARKFKWCYGTPRKGYIMGKEQTSSPEVVVPLENLPDYASIRTAKGIELKDLAQATKIRLSYLDAIEKGQFERLPEPIYSEAFIKKYAAIVKVDPDLLFAHYSQYLEQKKVPLNEPAIRQNKMHASELVGKDSNSKFNFKAVGWTISILVVIGLLVSFFSVHMNNDNKPEWQPSSSPPRSEQPASVNQGAAVAGSNPGTPSTANVDGVSTGAAPVESTPVAHPAKTSYKLSIEASETSWVNIVEDDNPPFEVLLRPGERIDREASEKFSLDIGNAGGVTVSFQGKALGRLGQNGQVVHLLLPESR